MRVRVAVDAFRITSDDFPGFAEVDFVDAAGKLHTIADKIPIFTSVSIPTASSDFGIDATVIDEQPDGLLTVQLTWNDTTEGLRTVTVRRSQLQGD